MKTLIPLEVIERRILLIRGQKVILGTHLAELYDVETRVLNQAVKRNISRFPEDFMFQLNISEAERLASQSVIPHKNYFGGSLPYASPGTVLENIHAYGRLEEKFKCLPRDGIGIYRFKRASLKVKLEPV